MTTTRKLFPAAIVVLAVATVLIGCSTKRGPYDGKWRGRTARSSLVGHDFAVEFDVSDDTVKSFAVTNPELNFPHKYDDECPIRDDGSFEIRWFKGQFISDTDVEGIMVSSSAEPTLGWSATKQ